MEEDPKIQCPVGGKFVANCKYGENPWIKDASLYSEETADPLAMDKFELAAGQPPSFINWTDINRLLQYCTHIAAGFDINFKFVPPIAVAVKHGNACGAGVGFGDNPEINAIRKMILGDQRAIFGGVVMVNFEIDVDRAEVLLTYLMEGGRRLLDCVVAPSITPDAIELLKRKGNKCRFLVNTALASLTKDSLDISTFVRQVRGGWLVQGNYTFVLDHNDPELEKIGPAPTMEQKLSLVLAQSIGRLSNSNTVTLVKKNYLIGNGVAQQDRVGAAKVALFRAAESGHQIDQTVVADSDSFFPFNDGVEVLVDAGVGFVCASSGSVNDKRLKPYAEEKGFSLWLYPDTLGRGFAWHG